MSAETILLQEKLSQLLRWEKRKRREQVLLAVIFYSLAASLVALPVCALVLPGVSPWLVPGLFFIPLAPWHFFRRRWRRADGVRALARVDHALRLDERTITAWEILAREPARSPEFLVLREASTGLRRLEPRTLFPRQWSWQGYLLVPLFALWWALLWFDVALPSRSAMLPSIPTGNAQKLREYSRELQQKAEREGLRDSLKIGQELEKMARRQLEKQVSEEGFRRELSAMAKKIEAMGGAGSSDAESMAAASSQGNLKDLKAELEAARDRLNFPAAESGTSQEESRWLERLAALPQLKRQFDLKGQRAQGFDKNEITSFLDKLDKQVSGELDRRTLLDAQQFLEQLVKPKQRDKEKSNVEVAGQGAADLPADGEEAKTRSNQAGKEPGRSGGAFQPVPNFGAGAAAQLKGTLGAGQSSGIMLKGKPEPGQSVLGQDEVMTLYRRQAEAELNTERVPEGLKETVKRYFLSLGRENGNP